MGNSLPFWKDKTEVNEEPSEKPSSVEALTSVLLRAAEEIDTQHLDQGPCSRTAITTRPVSVANPNSEELSDLGETEAFEQPQALRVEADASTVPQVSPITVVEGGTNKAEHSSSITDEDGSDGTSKAGHSTKTKKRRESKQHSKLTYVRAQLRSVLRITRLSV